MTEEERSALNPDANEAVLPAEPPPLETGAESKTTETEAETFAEELTENEAEASSAIEPKVESEPENERAPGKPTPAKLDRLQKILAAAGVASRRHAEELITEGRVQVNGQVVTALGTKADPEHDHIRVDGKLLHGAERLRYFMLNKPKGFVTTVTDPEGRPTVMQFFARRKERLYPVGRLDYMSEGLLVVTNDGDLANRLTKAASGVEKTYLVKVSGQPSEGEIEQLRHGVAIDREGPGSGKVHTAPAQIRQVRQGDNPWFEVVLTEGRNRELRKIFETIGHHVEKIRRVGYGPLVLDLEPGHMRELDADELAELRKAAEGKLRKPTQQETRRRKAMAEASLPTTPPRPKRSKPFAERDSVPGRTSKTKENFRGEKAKRPYRREEGENRFPQRPPRPSRPEQDRPRQNRPRRDGSNEWADRPRFYAKPSGAGRPRREEDKQPRPFASRGSNRPVGKSRPPFRSQKDFASPKRAFQDRTPQDRASQDRTFQGRPSQSRAFPDKPGRARNREAGEGPERRPDRKPGRTANPDWKPRPAYGGTGRPASGTRPSGTRPKSKPGGFAKPGFKRRPSGGPKRSSPRPGGARSSGPRSSGPRSDKKRRG